MQAQDVIEAGGDPPTHGGPANTGDPSQPGERGSRLRRSAYDTKRKRASVSATS